MKGDEIAEALQLRKVYTGGNNKITPEHLEGFSHVVGSLFVR